jgi:hypothetical protein
MSMRVRITAVAFAFAMMSAGVGCSIIAPHAGPSKNPSASSSAASAAANPFSDTSLPGRWTTDVMAQAFTAINQKIGANPADYVEVVLNGVTVTAKAINPQKRQNVDEYAYDGAGVKVTPVDVSNNEPGAVEESAFKSDTVKPEVLATVMGSAVKDSGYDDVRIIAVTAMKEFANAPEPIIQVTVNGPRASKVVRYDLNGQFKNVV